jgi:hypothetical protein
MTIQITQQRTRTILLVLVDSLLIFMITCVSPFAWILKDGIGPDSVTTTGLEALKEFLMTFYLGPIVLLLGIFEFLLRRAASPEKQHTKQTTMTLWFIGITIFSLLSFVVALIFTRN